MSHVTQPHRLALIVTQVPEPEQQTNPDAWAEAPYATVTGDESVRAHVQMCVEAHDELVALLDGLLSRGTVLTCLEDDELEEARALLAKVKPNA